MEETTDQITQQTSPDIKLAMKYGYAGLFADRESLESVNRWVESCLPRLGDAQVHAMTLIYVMQNTHARLRAKSEIEMQERIHELEASLEAHEEIIKRSNEADAKVAKRVIELKEYVKQLEEKCDAYDEVIADYQSVEIELEHAKAIIRHHNTECRPDTVTLCKLVRGWLEASLAPEGDSYDEIMSLIDKLERLLK